MKKLLFVILLMAFVLKGFGQISKFSYPSSVDLFGLCEISFKLPKIYVNPYDPDTISVYAEFTGPDNSTYIVNAFYYEDYTFQQHINGYETATYDSQYDGWRIRFTPTVLGTWTFVIRGSDNSGSLNAAFMNVNYTFSCTSVSNADGFISKANSRYLKRDVVRNGQRQIHSFFPIGPDVAWYSCVKYAYNNYYYLDLSQPYGIYDYKRYIDSLVGNANYMRVFINRYQYLSLYGPEYTQLENGNPKVYFDSIINQKDSAELDYIISYALQHGITITPCIFNCGDFRYANSDPSDVGIWANNPFNNILDLSEPCVFFTSAEAKRITKNLLRYIISRWGYAANVFCWELWNEVDHVSEICDNNGELGQNILDWHDEMANYIRAIDPFGHCISSSVGGDYGLPAFSEIFQNLDITQRHTYQNIQIARSRFELPNTLYHSANKSHSQYSIDPKPFFQAEFGFSQSKHPYAIEKDPMGVSLHNSLWSSLFLASIGSASFWWWNYLDICGMYNRFAPMLNFSQNLPILSSTFTAKRTGDEDENEGVIVFPNGLETYYMINGSEDTIMGWSQDTAFTYQALRWLTDSVRLHNDTLSDGTILWAYYYVDSVPYDTSGYLYTLDPLKRPQPSSNSNIITLPITNQPIGSRYMVKWYDSETGNALNPEVTTYAFVQQDFQGNKNVSFQFPSRIRDLQQQTINNTFGDAVFVIILKNLPKSLSINRKYSKKK